MRFLSLIAVILAGVVLLFAVGDFPAWGDKDSPASSHVAPYYLAHTMEDTAVPNAVTSILADYRGFDTMFETTVIFTAGVAVMLILRRRRRTGVLLTADEVEEREQDGSYTDIINKLICRLVIPFMQLFALYVIAHGHLSPGGGFQGGVILGASFILMGLSHNLSAILERMKETTVVVAANIGVFIYAGIGLLALILGANFLDYGVLEKILPATDAVMARSYGIFGVEAGVGIAVMAIMIIIYLNISSNGKFDRGL